MPGRNDGFLSTLAASAKEAVREGYYTYVPGPRPARRSLVSAVEGAEGSAIIAEVKFVSPAGGRLATKSSAAKIAEEYERGGAVAISVLTEKKHFGGELADLVEVKRAVSIPVLMKDVIVDKKQVDAASALGADAVLLISEVFGAGWQGPRLGEMIDYAHAMGLEVLLEAHSPSEYERALGSRADLVGINNRDLKTLRVSTIRSKKLLKRFPRGKPVVCESGLSTRRDIVELGELGADAFLVGSVLMKSRDRGDTLRMLRGQ